MKHIIKQGLRKIPFLRATKRGIVAYLEKRDREYCDSLLIFAPNSRGFTAVRAKLTTLAASETFPLLVRLLEATGRSPLPIVKPEEFASAPEEIQAAAELKVHFDRYGSDKSLYHNYHFVYAKMLINRSAITQMLEIGLGTTAPEIVSTMGAGASPGASIRAFRDFLPSAMVYGADIDDRILFEEDRIKTYHVDQTDLATLDRLSQNIPGELDLIIDDGLHSPNANLAVLLFSLKKLKVGGWLSVEDIHEKAYPVWAVVASMLPATFESHMIMAEGCAMIFAVRRLA